MKHLGDMKVEISNPDKVLFPDEHIVVPLDRSADFDMVRSFARDPVPHAVRAKPGAPVTTPLDWEDFSDARLVSTRYHIGNVFKRLAQKTDPWKSISRRGRSLNEPRRRLASLIEKE